MTIPEHIKQRRHDELVTCFSVVDACLASYYSGSVQMYRPMAGQLRILFCDTPPLLSRVFRKLKIGSVRKIEWLEPGQVVLFEGTAASLSVQHPPDQEFRLARMPFLITTYENGLQVADLEFDPAGEVLSLDKWVRQLVTIHPSEVTIREIINSVANKGGGSHIDDEINTALRHMQLSGPRGVGVHVLFTIALARFTQTFGLYYTQFRERFGYVGKLEEIAAVFDPKHPSVQSRAKVPEGLEHGRRELFSLTALKRIR